MNKDFDKDYAAIQPFTIVPRERCEMLYRLSQYAAKLPGPIAEVGSYKGGTAMLLKRANPTKDVYAFDTFAGIPNADPDEDVHVNGDFGDLKYGDVSTRLIGNGVKVRPGYFPTTTNGMEDFRFCFAHFDGDTYQSCKDFLAFFWPRMDNGAIMVFDDWRWHQCPGVERAVTEHCNATGAWPFHTASFQVALTVCR